MKNVIHKTFEVTAEADEQIVGGFITTGNRDRHGDIVESAGCDTSALQVLLEGHNHDMPVGRLIGTEEREGGIYARFKVLADDVWQKVKAGLYPAFSIGFLPKEAEPMKDGGWLYRSVEVIETSLVAVPSNRESQILEVRNAPEAIMTTEATAPVGKTVKQVSPAIHTERHEYNLRKAIADCVQQRQPQGLEGEIDVELRRQQSWREFGGAAIPLHEIFLDSSQKRELAAKCKASGVVDSGNLAVLTGEQHLDELFTWIDTAIARQILSGRVGARVLTGLVEASAVIPRQETMSTAGHVALDSDLPDSADPTFTNQTLEPRLVGGVSQLNLSAVLAQHPQINEDFIARDLRRALSNELERVFISGDATGTAGVEPNGLANLADDGDSLVAKTSTFIDDYNLAVRTYEDYAQETDTTLSWLLPPEQLDGLDTAPAWTGATGTTAADALNAKMARLYRALNLIESTGVYEGYFGEFEYVVQGLWQSADVSLNMWADSVFKKKASLIRISMMHDISIIDAHRIRKIAVTPAG